ncbi:HPP family protein [Fundidesulfovibrio terrae]|uniref:CBS domain-containing protein n=1 Tax=Fundidesulfovibrio terrae TaxID=2922866 RepID=UPI001FAFE893|nr:CBS domain-containing protein [Fundidesulfovibrio terrae]
MKISTIMNRQVAKTGPGESFAKVLAAMQAMPSRLLHVVDADDRLMGIISSYDVLKVMMPFYLDSNLAKAVTDDENFVRRLLADNAHLTAADIMAVDIITLHEDSHLLEAEALIKEKAVNALPVLDEQGHVVGEVTRQAILSQFIELCAPASSEQ